MNSQLRVLLPLLLLLMLAGCHPSSDRAVVAAAMSRVISGQTIEVVIDNSLYTVRLAGIDAPDLRQIPWGRAARDKLIELIEDNSGGPLKSIVLKLETDLNQKDRYNRLRAYVWSQDQKKLINEELASHGHALADLTSTDGRYAERFRFAQDYARIMGYGIWNVDNPMGSTPAQFRQALDR